MINLTNVIKVFVFFGISIAKEECFYRYFRILQCKKLSEIEIDSVQGFARFCFSLWNSWFPGCLNLVSIDNFSNSLLFLSKIWLSLVVSFSR